MNAPNVDMQKIADAWTEAGNKYISEAFTDRIKNWLSELFCEEVTKAGLDQLPVVATDALYYDDDQDTLCIHGPDGPLQAVRLVTDRCAMDMEELAFRPTVLPPSLEAAMSAYVRAIEEDVRTVIVPTLYVKVEAYLATWYLWGYVGKPLPTAGAKGSA